MSPNEYSWMQGIVLGFAFLFLSSLTPGVVWLCSRTRRKRRTEHSERRAALKDIETGTNSNIPPFKGIQRGIDTNIEGIATDDTDTIPFEGIPIGTDDTSTVPIESMQIGTDVINKVPCEGEPHFELSTTLQGGGYEGRSPSFHALEPVVDVLKSSPLLEETLEVDHNHLAKLRRIEDELAQVVLEQAEITREFDRKQADIESELDRKHLRQRPSYRTGISVRSLFPRGPQIGGPSKVTTGKKRKKKI